MKYFNLNNTEQKILNDFEKGKYTPVARLSQQKKVYTGMAKATLGKAKNINIRLTQKVLQKLKARAVEEGIPYQTLAASILHKYALGSSRLLFLSH